MEYQMQIINIDPDFDERITDEECTKLIEVLAKLLPGALPNSMITDIKIKPYPTRLREQNRCTDPAHTYRVDCACKYGNEQVIIGEDPDHGWIVVKAPAAVRPSHRKTSLR